MVARLIAVAFGCLLCAWPLALNATQSDSQQSADQGAAAKHAAIIRQFFESIDKHRVGDALNMMAPELVPDAKAKAGWTRQFTAIRSIRVLSIQPVDLGDNGACYEYRVTLEVHVAAQAARAPIPSYGWGRNPNLRWLTLCPNGRSWRISSIGTGP